jgi:hypothetical protein
MARDRAETTDAEVAATSVEEPTQDDVDAAVIAAATAGTEAHAAELAATEAAENPPPEIP